jgi:CRISPR-associated protein Cmr1
VNGKGRKVITATYRLSAPCLSGGHEHKAELRLSAIKGQLRFWWRALAWPLAIDQVTPPKDELDAAILKAKALSWLHQQEGFLFGNIADNNMRQSSVIMSLQCDAEPNTTISTKGVGQEQNIEFNYLLCEVSGKTVLHDQKIINRSYIKTHTEFTLRLLIKPKAVDAINLPLLLDALKVLGSLGGIGARAKKGFGSLSLVKLTHDNHTEQPPAEEKAFLNWLKQLVSPYQRHEQPPFSAFSSTCRIYQLPAGRDDLGTLKKLQRDLQNSRVRSDYKGNPNLNPLFIKDYEQLKDVVLNNQTFKQIPQRVALGLPIQSKLGKGRATIEFSITAENHERRASPIQFHLQYLANGQYLLLATLLQADFLPAGETIEVKITKKNNSPVRDKPLDHPQRITDEAAFWQAPVKLLKAIGAKEIGL